VRPPRPRPASPPPARASRSVGAATPGGGAPVDTRGCLYQPDFLTEAERDTLLAWLGTLRPLWEWRYSTVRPPPRGESQRALLRPVYWLGNWQFACLGYYEPPRRVRDCAVAAEPFPPFLARIVARIERRVRGSLPPAFVPPGWSLNTCLVNFYGDRLVDGAWIDAARVGEHRDFELGPVGSLSLGERARFQFVRRGRNEAPVRTVWLEDRSLQAFAGPFWKDALLHRVQRVEDRLGVALPPAIDGFRTRRVNLTFRCVPDACVVPYARLGTQAREDVRGYVATLAEASPFWAAARDAAGHGPLAGGGAGDLDG
jgi:alkylated DNA repair protein (DNA oxidative demethylase)